MAQISLNIPDAALPRVIEALCARGHWSPELGIPKGAFAKQALVAWLKDEVQRYEHRQAELAAVAAVVRPDAVDIT